MNIRQIKDFLVDMLLHPSTSISEGWEYESWKIKNDVTSKYLSIIIDNDGIKITLDDDWNEMHQILPWSLFTSSYKEEIVSCLSVNEKMDPYIGEEVNILIRASSR